MSHSRKALLWAILVGIVLFGGWAGYWYGLDGRTRYLAGSADPRQRLEALPRLAATDSPRGRELLEELVADPVAEVRQAAVRALAGRTDQRGHDFLQRLLSSADDPAVRGAAAAGLGLIRQTDPDLLVRCLPPGNPDEVRRGAALGLARLAELVPLRVQPCVPDLVGRLRDPDAQVRAWSITAISNVAIHHFAFDAQAQPPGQEASIRQIEARLGEMGLLPEGEASAGHAVTPP